MRLDNQDINGVIPLAKKGIDKYFHAKINTMKLLIQNNRIYFDGQGVYKGFNFKIDGSCEVVFSKDCFIFKFYQSFIRTAFMNIELENFIKQFLKQDPSIFFNNNQLYIKTTISPIAIKIHHFEIMNNEILLHVDVLS